MVKWSSAEDNLRRLMAGVFRVDRAGTTSAAHRLFGEIRTPAIARLPKL
ncbi:hypothetical protein ACQEVZ_58595 [Dactylosporangium sp. CA-152071]